MRETITPGLISKEDFSDPNEMKGKENSHYSISKDTILWNNFRAGDKDSFDQIYKAFVKPLYNYGLKITYNKELVLDCIQDVFVDLFTHLKTLGDTNNIKLYLFISLKRKLIRSLQKENQTKIVSEDTFQFITNYSHEHENYNSSVDTKKVILLYKALGELSERQKEAIYLRFVNEMEYEEMCMMLNMNYQSVRNLIHRAIEKLRKILTSFIFLLFIFHI